VRKVTRRKREKEIDRDRQRKREIEREIARERKRERKREREAKTYILGTLHTQFFISCFVCLLRLLGLCSQSCTGRLRASSQQPLPCNAVEEAHLREEEKGPGRVRMRRGAV
jgi:hypothetical protein